MSDEKNDPDIIDHDVPRTAEEIARRAIIIQCVIAAGYGVSKKNIRQWLKEECLWGHVSPREQKFLLTSKPTKKEVYGATWRAECQVALLWSIQKIESLGSLSGHCDSGLLVDAVPGLLTPTSDFISHAVLREREVIDDEYEKIYNAHCEVRHAIREGTLIPDGMIPGIVQERHYAMNWITGYCGQGWDDITTDT